MARPCVGKARNGLVRFGSVIFFSVVMLIVNCSPAKAFPAFARKYGMPCSACHQAWPMLSPFGQQFKDNGYQLGNDRDAPIFQSPAYWPIAFRITPNWHLENSQNLPVVSTATGNPTTASVTTQGFDYGGLDILTGGTLAKNFSFLLVPSSDETGAFHFESVNVRFDNILNSSWFNIKVGKFELDNLLSEKRILTLSETGGYYQNYHFQPWIAPGQPSSIYVFGIGDNQLGMEWMGHSRDDRTRLSVSLLSPTDGNPDFINGIGTASGNTYDVYLAGSRAFEAGSLGLQRVGGFAYFGHTPTYAKYTYDGVAPVGGTGAGNEPYYRIGFIGMWYLHKLDVTTMYFWGKDNVYLGTGTPVNSETGLPEGAHAPTWNGGLIETHYTFNPQMIFINRYELIRMSQQALSSNPGNTGNTDALTFGFRYYPFINSRAGFAFHNEYSIVWNRNININPSTGLPIGLTSSSLMFGFDFAF
ncbi:MAG TPA: hypothetical protein VMH31_03090 [Methylomirabilota bacterium]|nr:hypothetical protein [Methylomirabilota bacterium]